MFWSVTTVNEDLFCCSIMLLMNMNAAHECFIDAGSNLNFCIAF